MSSLGPTPNPVVTSVESQASVFYTPNNTLPPQLTVEQPIPQPTTAVIPEGNTYEGAPVQGMETPRGEGLSPYQNMSQILFHKNLKKCSEDSSWFDKNSTTYQNFVDSNHSNTSSNQCINDAYEEQVRLSYHYKNMK